MTTPAALELIWQALSLQDTPYLLVAEGEGGLRLALIIVFLAGLSQGLGQSVVLFANSVKPRRFAASLVVSGVLYVSGFMFFVLSIWLVAEFVFGRSQSLPTVLTMTGLAYTPYLLGFFILAPYFGSFIAVALSLWSLVALVNALRVTLELSLLQALLCSGLGWLVLQVLSVTVGQPIQWLASKLRQVAAGQHLELNRDKLRDLIEQGRKK